MPSDTPSGMPLPVLLLRTAGQPLALRRHDVVEILPVPRLATAPGAPLIVSGCFQLGPEMVLVLPLAGLLGLAAPAEGDPLYHHLLLLADQPGHPRLALLVDRVLGLAEAAPSPLPPGDSFNDCLEGDVRVDGNLVPLLAAPRLLTRYEVDRLADFAARAATREAVFAVTDLA